jgi:hypothetical protein
MELAKIDVAPKNGDFIILQDACSREVGRWAQEANGWVQPDGTPVRISPTHWTRVSDDFAGPTDRERSLFLAALAAPLPDDETEQPQKRPLTRLILALVTAIFCIGGFVFWIGSNDSSSDNSAANLERGFSRERERASVAIGRLTAAREREDVAPTEALESKRIANSKRRDLKQALDKSQAKSEALARELASARESEVAARNLIAVRERENAARALETKQIADAKQKELQQALDESQARPEALARELASARESEVAARNLVAVRERENAAQALETKQIADAKQKEFKQALDESQARPEALARELASARENEVAARNLAATRERENAAQALETKQIADAKQKEFKQALDESEKRALALKRELTSARETIASAEQPSKAEVTARDAAAPTGPLNRPTEQWNAASEITSSMTTPQSRGNVTAGVQASSDATPDDATAGASLSPIPASADPIAWQRYAVPETSAAVDIPTTIFTEDAGKPTTGYGRRFLTSDGRADLTVQSVPNDAGDSPAVFLAKMNPPSNIVYKRVTPRFFVVSSVRNGKIWYNRCNFARRFMNCVLINYPAAEKRQWDSVVTRISNTLASR